MKLSEMNTEQLCDVLCEIAEPVDKIGTDEAFAQKLKEVAERGALNKIQSMTAMFGAFVPLLLKNKRAESIKIISVLSGKSVDEIAKQSGMQTLKDAMDCIDEDFIRFFKQSAGTDAGKSSQQPQEA